MIFLFEFEDHLKQFYLKTPIDSRIPICRQFFTTQHFYKKKAKHTGFILQNLMFYTVLIGF